MKSDATTVEEYLAGLPQQRQADLETVREVILNNLAEGFVESMNFGMIAYEVPLEMFPDTYNKQPLMYAALASQKNYMIVYLMSIYATEEARTKFERVYEASGKPMDVGKSCVRFKRVEDLPLDLIGEAITSQTPESYIAHYRKIRGT